MPTKNRRHLIQDTIQSIVDQTFDDWELIVIDDHSQDQTLQVVKNFHDPRIKYFYLTKGTGPGAARDFGIKKATADIIVLVDSDDQCYSERLKITYDFFIKNPDVSIVYGRSNRLDEKTDQITPRQTCDFDRRLLKYYNFISNVTTAFKKESYLKTKGYDPNIKTSEDYDLWLTFLEKGFKFAFINKPLTLQKIHSQSVSSQTEFKKRRENLAYVRKKHHLPVPRPQEVKKLVNKELWNFIFTPKGKKFWFGI